MARKSAPIPRQAYRDVLANVIGSLGPSDYQLNAADQARRALAHNYLVSQTWKPTPPPKKKSDGGGGFWDSLKSFGGDALGTIGNVLSLPADVVSSGVKEGMDALGAFGDSQHASWSDFFRGANPWDEKHAVTPADLAGFGSNHDITLNGKHYWGNLDKGIVYNKDSVAKLADSKTAFPNWVPFVGGAPIARTVGTIGFDVAGDPLSVLTAGGGEALNAERLVKNAEHAAQLEHAAALEKGLSEAEAVARSKQVIEHGKEALARFREGGYKALTEADKAAFETSKLVPSMRVFGTGAVGKRTLGKVLPYFSEERYVPLVSQEGKVANALTQVSSDARRALTAAAYGKDGASRLALLSSGTAADKQAKALLRSGSPDVFGIPKANLLGRLGDKRQAAIVAQDLRAWDRVVKKLPKTSLDEVMAGLEGDAALAAKHEGTVTELRKIYDSIHQRLTDAGVPVGYHENYLPHMLSADAKRALGIKGGDVKGTKAFFENARTITDPTKGAVDWLGGTIDGATAGERRAQAEAIFKKFVEERSASNPQLATELDAAKATLFNPNQREVFARYSEIAARRQVLEQNRRVLASLGYGDLASGTPDVPPGMAASGLDVPPNPVMPSGPPPALTQAPMESAPMPPTMSGDINGAGSVPAMAGTSGGPSPVSMMDGGTAPSDLALSGYSRPADPLDVHAPTVAAVPPHQDSLASATQIAADAPPPVFQVQDGVATATTNSFGQARRQAKDAVQVADWHAKRLDVLESEFNQLEKDQTVLARAVDAGRNPEFDLNAVARPKSSLDHSYDYGPIAPTREDMAKIDARAKQVGRARAVAEWRNGDPVGRVLSGEDTSVFGDVHHSIRKKIDAVFKPIRDRIDAERTLENVNREIQKQQAIAAVMSPDHAMRAQVDTALASLQVARATALKVLAGLPEAKPFRSVDEMLTALSEAGVGAKRMQVFRNKIDKLLPENQGMSDLRTAFAGLKERGLIPEGIKSVEDMTVEQRQAFLEGLGKINAEMRRTNIPDPYAGVHAPMEIQAHAANIERQQEIVAQVARVAGLDPHQMDSIYTTVESAGGFSRERLPSEVLPHLLERARARIDDARKAALAQQALVEAGAIRKPQLAVEMDAARSAADQLNHSTELLAAPMDPMAADVAAQGAGVTPAERMVEAYNTVANETARRMDSMPSMPSFSSGSGGSPLARSKTNGLGPSGIMQSGTSVPPPSSMPSAVVEHVQNQMRDALRQQVYAGVVLPDELMQHLLHIERVPGAIPFFDRMVNWTKAWQITSPGFHVRNMLGGIINNAAYGMDGVPLDSYRVARWFANDGRVETANAKQLSMILGRKVSQSGVEAARAEAVKVRQMVAESIGRGQIGSEFTHTKAWIENAKPHRIRNLVNPTTNNTLVRSSANAGEHVEGILRGALAHKVLMDVGVNDPTAMEKVYEWVDKLHFDYNRLSTGERKVKKIIPFYTWTRRNVPLQAEMMLTKPRIMNRYLTIKRDVEQMSSPDKVTPDYMSGFGFIRLPLMMNGGHVFASPTTPMNDLADATSSNPLETALSMVSPIAKTPVELMLRKQFWKGLPLRSFGQGGETPDPTNGFLGRLLEPMGWAHKAKDGTYWMGENTSYAVGQYLPWVARTARLFPSSQSKYKDRVFTAWLSFLGFGERTNTLDEQQRQLYAQKIKSGLSKREQARVAKILAAQG